MESMRNSMTAKQTGTLPVSGYFLYSAAAHGYSIKNTSATIGNIIMHALILTYKRFLMKIGRYVSEPVPRTCHGVFFWD